VIDRERVAGLIGSHYGQGHGEDVLGQLEDAGYRVVRAGMVPDFKSLETVQGRFAEMAEMMTKRLSDNAFRTTASSISQVIQLSMIALGIDVNDVDKVSE
jgi:hypothetical protein